MSTIRSDQNSYTPTTPPAYGNGRAMGVYGTPVLAPRNGLGTAALVIGILALLSGVVLVGAIVGVIAIVLGFAARARVRRGVATNGGSAIAGIVTGFLGIIIAGVVIAAGVSFLSSTNGKNYIHCVTAAHSNRAAIDQCGTTYLHK